MEDKKCIVMLSNGLDSRLSVKIMKEKGFHVTVLFCKLPFSKDVESEIKKFCKEQKVKLKILDFTKCKLFKDYLKIIKKPCYGRGTSMNPCVDCKILMFKEAKKIADKNKIRYIATGEVFGQRPMSQTKDRIRLIEEKSNLKNRIIRPLTEYYNIEGRKRNKQISLANKFKISYPGPAGGCLLCEKLYCEKLKNILAKNKKLNYTDIVLLSIGRHVFFKDQHIILGRNMRENEFLEGQKGIKIIPKQPGPTALITDKKYVSKAKELIKKYSKHEVKNFEIKN